MATLMVYGMIVYNVSIEMGGVRPQAFVAALCELPIMAPIAFVLEMFVVGGLARGIAFSYMTPQDKPMFITLAISSAICAIMCPIMSLIAMLLFKEEKSACMWVEMWAINFPMAIMYQIFYCGPLVRFIFKMIFKRR